MRFLLKLVMKFAMMVAMVLIMGSVMRHGTSFLTGGAGMPGIPGMSGIPGAAEAPKFSSEEADLMSTVFKSALKLFSGTAKRDQLAGELSDKLYGGRADKTTMSELGIELVKPGAAPAPPGTGTSAANALPGVSLPNAQPGATQTNAQPVAKVAPAQPGGNVPAIPAVQPGQSASDRLAGTVRTDMLGRIWAQAKPYTMEMGLVPVVFLGMMLVNRIRRRRDPDFVPSTAIFMPPAETEPFDIKHPVHSLGAEEFELLVALIYQRQGYRISMSAGLSGGRGGDFTLQRKSEKILVQCKKLNLEHRVPVERVRELHEAMTTAAVPRGMYVASCGFTWDARNFAKAKGITLINARTLDELITAAREKPDEDLLDVSQWVTKLMSRVQMTPPHCPSCEAAMDQLNVSNGSVWVCSQRPDCRGRRCARKHQKPAPSAARKADAPTDEVKASADEVKA